MKPTIISSTALATLLLCAGPLLAEREGYSYLSYVGSDVALVSKGDDDSNARVNMPVMAGDRLTTGAGSRAEAVLADGTIVRFDAKTDLRFDLLARTFGADDDRTLLYLERGALSLETRSSASREQATRVDTDDATILLHDAGLYRVDTGRRGTEVYVQTGRAEVNTKSGRTVLKAGQYAFAAEGADLESDDVDFPRDRFTRFIEDRRERPRRSTNSHYVSTDYSYDYDTGDLDNNGSWVYVSSYNTYCWRPSVSAGWSPYTQGYWRWTPAGLTWVSYEPWGWLPYHYGSWVFTTGFGWCWMPGSSYSPAWVYWNYTPDYIGWCPIGYYGYYDTYYRHTRTWFGDRSGHGGYPHLAGRVDVTRIDPRGWNYIPSRRAGSRLDPIRDIVRGDRVGFRHGDIGVISTTPLRIDRGSSTSAVAIQEAVRRIPFGDVGSRRVDEGLTTILRREALPPGAQEDLRRSFTRGGAADVDSRRPTSPETVLSPRRIDSGTPLGGRAGDATGVGPVRRDREPGAVSEPSPRGAFRESRGDDWRTTVTRGLDRPVEDRGTRRGEPSSGVVAEPPARRADDSGWRSQGSQAAPRPVERSRSEERPSRRDDSGWRAQQPAPRAEAPRSEPSREAPAPRSYEAPPRSEPRREAPAPRSYEAPRSEPRREAPAPRSEPRHEAPPSRSYESPRSAPAPAPPAQSAPAPAPAPSERRSTSRDR